MTVDQAAAIRKEAFDAGYVAGIRQAIDILGVNEALTGRSEGAAVIALKAFLRPEEGGTLGRANRDG